MAYSPSPFILLLTLLCVFCPAAARLVHLAKNDDSKSNVTESRRRGITCPQGESDARHLSATILLVLAGLGTAANIAVMLVILGHSRVRRWSLGLIFHQCCVDCARALLLVPLGRSLLHCEPVLRCSLLETSFLLLATVSIVNLLTTVLNDAPILPEDESEETIIAISDPRDSSQCVGFGVFMIWFASITINLGPTFLSGAVMIPSSDDNVQTPSCPLVQGPYRHYVLNLLWILINLLCLALTIYHLNKLYRDFSTSSLAAVRIAALCTSLLNIQYQHGSPSSHLKRYIARMEKEGLVRVRMLSIITGSYLIFWGPLFLVTLWHWSWGWEDAKISLAHEVCLHISYVHSIVNPVLYMALHQGLRTAAASLVCCSAETSGCENLGGSRGAAQSSEKCQERTTPRHMGNYLVEEKLVTVL